MLLALLCEDWKYKVVDNATKGMTDYGGKSRLQLVSENIKFNTAFEKIDTINQASLMIQRLKPLTKIQFESLFK
ncbi:unnamed protein product [marine sediment metagenome]|uniref:Uncharacterized protein n=1 Tax=marine sediment metagenome TaxID=412755 RepID=X0WJM9_9ZZZZ